MLVIVCPGQGAQKPGFLSPWLELPGLRERLDGYATAAGVDLATHGTVSDEATIKDTAVAQPLIVGAGLLALHALLDDASASAGALSGHSVGEITATAAAGVLTDEAAMAFVGRRGRAMAAASAVHPTGMSAVVGGDATDVLDTLDRFGLTGANLNGAGQIVAAGTLDQLAELTENPPAKARVIPLSVAGAFHTVHMEPAVGELSEFADTLTPADARTSVVSNRDGESLTDGGEILTRLVEQVRRPVRWDRCMETFSALGVTAMIEVPPAGTLVGLAKRALPGVKTLALRTPDDLDAARALITEHGGLAPAGSDAASARGDGTAQPGAVAGNDAR